MNNIKTSNKKSLIIILLFFFLIIGLFYFTMGFFIIQPIGVIPEGITILYWRYNTKLSFISSADGILLERGNRVSLLGRGIILGTIGKLMNGRKIMNLPYSRTLYLISLKGRGYIDMCY